MPGVGHLEAHPRPGPALRTSSRTKPVCVNFTALLSRFSSTCRSRKLSPTTRGGMAGSTSISIRSPFRSASTATSGRHCRQGLKTEGLADNFRCRPFSIREKSRIALTSLQQRPGRIADGLKTGALLGAERRVQRQLGHAQDAVERRADFVAHIGEEARLGLLGLFRFHHQPADLPCLAPHGASQHQDPDCGQKNPGAQRGSAPFQPLQLGQLGRSQHHDIAWRTQPQLILVGFFRDQDPGRLHLRSHGRRAGQLRRRLGVAADVDTKRRAGRPQPDDVPRLADRDALHAAFDANQASCRPPVQGLGKGKLPGRRRPVPRNHRDTRLQ